MKELVSWSQAMPAHTNPTAWWPKGGKGAEEEGTEAEQAKQEGGVGWGEEVRKETIRVDGWQNPSV